MADRRTLVEGLKNTPSPIETDFVYRNKETSPDQSESKVAAPPQTTPHQARSPISTRIRSDFAGALKRASLERQLAGKTPNTLQDILEEAIEPWLRTNGYLS